MHPFRSLAALAFAAALCSCQNEPTASDDPSAKGGLALAFSARALAQMGPASDSLHLRLLGERDTIQSISRLGDTVRFDGLRPGRWSIDAEVYGNDSGSREVSWIGFASTEVEPGRIARVPLVLRKPTGSLIVDIDIEDDLLDTPTVIAPEDTSERIDPADSARWSRDRTRYLLVPHHDTSGAWIPGAALLLDAWIGPNGVVARVAVHGGGNAVDGIVSPVFDHCGDTGVDTLCLPYTIQLVGRPSSRLAGNVDTSTRIVETVIALSGLRNRQIVLRDDYGNFRTVEDLSQDMSRCEILEGGKGLCHDSAGFQTSFLAPFAP